MDGTARWCANPQDGSLQQRCVHRDCIWEPWGAMHTQSCRSQAETKRALMRSVIAGDSCGGCEQFEIQIAGRNGRARSCLGMGQP